jgi:hypothetical protein
MHLTGGGVAYSHLGVSGDSRGISGAPRSQLSADTEPKPVGKSQK